MALRLRHRLCLAVDLRQYGRHTPEEQLDGQARLVRVIEHAVRRTQISRIRIQRQYQGDGLLAVFPPGIDDVHVVPSLILGLRDGLYQTNQVPGPFGRLRMRSAIGRGSISRAPSGYVGTSVIEVSRMVDSAGLRGELERRECSDLALAITQDLYTGVISLAPPGLPATEFTPATLDNPGKEYATSAWIYVPRAAPARDLSAEAVRWGDTPARSALKEYVVPAISAAPVVTAVGHILVSSPIREWFLPSHEKPADDHNGPDPDFDDHAYHGHHHDSPVHSHEYDAHHGGTDAHHHDVHHANTHYGHHDTDHSTVDDHGHHLHHGHDSVPFDPNGH
jgi:hypothetical protein